MFLSNSLPANKVDGRYFFQRCLSVILSTGESVDGYVSSDYHQVSLAVVGMLSVEVCPGAWGFVQRVWVCPVVGIP